MDTVSVSVPDGAVDGFVNALSSGDWKMVGAWAAVIGVTVGGTLLAKKFGIVFKKKTR